MFFFGSMVSCLENSRRSASCIGQSSFRFVDKRAKGIVFLEADSLEQQALYAIVTNSCNVGVFIVFRQTIQL